MTTTTDHQLTQCAHCGRHGWHETDKCPERTTWRSYKDRLTVEQIQLLEDRERQELGQDNAEQRSDVVTQLRWMGWKFADKNASDALPPVPAPAGTTPEDNWLDPTSDRPWRRCFGTTWIVERTDYPRENLEISVWAAQTTDGRAERFISLDSWDNETLTLDEAELYLEAIREAVEEAREGNANDVVPPQPSGGGGIW